MIGKAGLATIVLIAVLGGRSVDLRQLYDEMYPVNTLKRDAFSLCGQSDPTFVRAWEDDRESCYDRMPQSIGLAIGRIQPRNALNGLFAGSGRFPGGMFLPEAGLYSWAMPARPPAVPRNRPTGLGVPPCASPPDPLAAADPRTAQALGALSGRGGASPEMKLAEMGLLPRQHQGGNSAAKPAPLLRPGPVARGTPPAPAEPAGLTPDRPDTIRPLDTVAGELGDAADAGCGAPI